MAKDRDGSGGDPPYKVYGGGGRRRRKAPVPGDAPPPQAFGGAPVAPGGLPPHTPPRGAPSPGPAPPATPRQPRPGGGSPPPGAPPPAPGAPPPAPGAPPPAPGAPPPAPGAPPPLPGGGPAVGPDGLTPVRHYRAAPGFLAGRGGRGNRGQDGTGRRVSLSPLRVLLVLVLAVVCWLGLTVVLFIVSAQTQAGDIPESAQEALDDGGDLLVEPNTILVLGSDQRPKNSKEPGANDAPPRADSIMLLRAGGGSSGRLSIPRDTVVEIPEVGPQKINAAYAIGGPALMIDSLKRFLGIEIHHLIEVDFENFPKLIDALGGVEWEGKRVCAKVNGGNKNGGVTVNVRKGDELDGRVALALARVRSNDCAPNEDDLDRASRQQQILGGMKSAALSPLTFFRAPWVAWQAPQAIRTDIGPLGLTELAIDVGLAGTPKPRVLKPSGFIDLPDGGQGLAVDQTEVKAAVRQFEGD